MYTIREVAAEFKVSYKKIYDMVRAAEIRSVRIGKQYRIPADELARLKTPVISTASARVKVEAN